jgi:hypothetical protein
VARHDYFSLAWTPSQQASLGQLLVRKQRRRDDQWLCDCGVGNLLGGGRRPQAGEIEANGLGPRGDNRVSSGQLKPGGEHPGGLRTLSGRKQGKRVLGHGLRKHCEDGFARCKRL